MRIIDLSADVCSSDLLHRANPRSEGRGQFEPTTWEHALGDISARINALSEKHGPDSVAVYFGNPSVFNAGGLMMTSVFLETLGTRMRFSAATLDASNCGASAAQGTHQLAKIDRKSTRLNSSH